MCVTMYAHASILCLLCAVRMLTFISCSLYIPLQQYLLGVSPQYFTGGITNKLIGCQCKSDTQDIVLIRVNGKGTEVVVDRDSEVQLFRLLATHGCAPPLYAIFRTGLAYGFCPGCPLDEKLVREEAVAL